MTGSTQPDGSVAQVTIRAHGDRELNFVAGMTPFSRGTDMLAYSDAVYLEDGTVVALILDASDLTEASARVNFSPLVRRLPSKDAEWSVETMRLFDDVVTMGTDSAAIGQLTTASQLQALAIGLMLGRRSLGGALPKIGEGTAVLVGEAFKKSGLGALAIPFLAEGGPRRLPVSAPMGDYATRIDLLCERSATAMTSVHC